MLFRLVFPPAYQGLLDMRNEKTMRDLYPHIFKYTENKSVLEPEILGGSVTCKRIKEQLLLWETGEPSERKLIKGFVPYQAHD